MYESNWKFNSLQSKESLSIEVTKNCNSNCSHCFVQPEIDNRLSISLHKIISILQEAYKIGFRHLHITGGEPFLWDHFFTLLSSAFDMGYSAVFCNTNGTLLTKEKCKHLSNYGDKVKFSVSLQGDEALHDQIRGKGSWKQAINGIENLIQAGVNFTIFSSIGKSLLKDLAYFTDGLFSKYPDMECLTLIQLIRVKNDYFDLSDELLTPEDFVKLVITSSLLNVYGHPVYILENPLVNVVDHLMNLNWNPRALPLHRTGHIFVKSNSEISLNHSSYISFGIYTPGMLDKVLKSKEYFESVRPDIGTCPECTYHEICSANGMIHPSGWYRDMNTDLPYCQRVIKSVMLF